MPARHTRIGCIAAAHADAQTVSPCTSPIYTTSATDGIWNTTGYEVHNEVWNTAEAGPQTLYVCNWDSWYVVSNQPGTGSDDSVKSYPCTVRDVNIPLSSMPASIPSSFNVTTPSAGGVVPANGMQWNSAYDIWLNNYAIEIMIWNNWTANWQYWYNTYGGTTVTISGVSYSAYYRATPPVGMWFVRNTVTNVASHDLVPIFNWALGQGWLNTSDSVNRINYGFEIMYTGTATNLYLNDYTIGA